jgi:hypothetical protein
LLAFRLREPEPGQDGKSQDYSLRGRLPLESLQAVYEGVYSRFPIVHDVRDVSRWHYFQCWLPDIVIGLCGAKGTAWEGCRTPPRGGLQEITQSTAKSAPPALSNHNLKSRRVTNQLCATRSRFTDRRH